MTKRSVICAFVVIAILAGLSAMGFYVMNKKNVQEYVAVEAQQKVVIGEDGLYVKKDDFSVFFPKNWTGCMVEEKDHIIIFSLRNLEGDYVPVLSMRDINWGDNIPASSYPLGGRGNLEKIFTALEDENAAQFGGAFAASDYPGIETDLRENIVPTFQFINGVSRSANEFRFSDIEVGDKIGAFTVVSIFPSNDGSNASQGLASLKPADITITFAGKINLKGDYEYGMFDSKSNSFGKIRFLPSADDYASLIPNMVAHGSTYLYFGNEDMARQYFSEGSSGEVEIFVDGLILHYSANKKEVINTTKLEKAEVIIDKDQPSTEIDTSDWITYEEKGFGVSVKAPKELYYYDEKIVSKLITEKNREGFSLFADADDTRSMFFKITNVQNDAELDAMIGVLVEGSTGCHLGSKNVWKYQEGVYEVQIEGEDWDEGADLGTTTCSWSGGAYTLLYSPTKMKAVFVSLGQEARFYLKPNDAAASIDGEIVSSFRFE